MSITIKRVYEPATKADGYRVLIDRLWPRGLKKEAVPLDLWAKELAPSTALRQWFGHDPALWDGFRHRYASELDALAEHWQKRPRGIPSPCSTARATKSTTTRWR